MSQRLLAHERPARCDHDCPHHGIERRVASGGGIPSGAWGVRRCVRVSSRATARTSAHVRGRWPCCRFRLVERSFVRIGLIASPWVAVPPVAYGGTEQVLDVLARGLQRAGHDVRLFATGDSTCPVPTTWVLERAVGVDAARPATELRQVINAYRSVEGLVDVVHDHTLAGPVYAQMVSGVPVVTTNHGPFGGELGDYYRAISGTVPIIAISRHQASTARDTIVSAIIHHGVDVHAMPVGDGRGGYALFMGRMTPDKGVHAAIRIARAAGVPLRIAAKMQEPAERAYFDAEVAPLLGDGVEFLGEVGGAAKLELLGAAECLLNPLAWPEPFGMVMIEALACGTPVVATPVGAVAEIVDDGITGFVRASGVDLSEAVRQVPTLDRGACRAAVEERFSADRMVGDHVTLYESVVRSHRRPMLVA